MAHTSKHQNHQNCIGISLTSRFNQSRTDQKRPNEIHPPRMEHWGTNSLSTELPYSRLARPSAFFCYLLSGKRNLLQLSHWHQKIQLLTAASPLCSIPSGVTTLACLKSKNFRSSGCPHVDCSYQQVNFNSDNQTITISLKGGNAKSRS